MFYLKRNVICFRHWGCRGRDRLVIAFITTFAISAYHH